MVYYDKIKFIVGRVGIEPTSPDFQSGALTNFATFPCVLPNVFHVILYGFTIFLTTNVVTLYANFQYVKEQIKKAPIFDRSLF